MYPFLYKISILSSYHFRSYSLDDIFSVIFSDVFSNGDEEEDDVGEVMLKNSIFLFSLFRFPFAKKNKKDGGDVGGEEDDIDGSADRWWCQKRRYQGKKDDNDKDGDVEEDVNDEEDDGGGGGGEEETSSKKPSVMKEVRKYGG